LFVVAPLQTPLDIAIRKGKNECAAFLRKSLQEQRRIAEQARQGRQRKEEEMNLLAAGGVIARFAGGWPWLL